MARTLDASYTAPEPVGHMAGQAIRGEYGPNPAFTWAALGQAANYVLARCHAKPVVCQAWGDSLVQQTSGTLTRACTWRIPKLTDAHTEVTVWAYLERAGTDGKIQMQSTEGADSVDLTAPASAAWVSGTLDVDFNADGYETLEMYVAGDGTDAVTVHSIVVQWSELSTLPETINGVPIFDDAQFDGDLPLSTWAANAYLAALDEALSRRQVYWNWSGIENSTNSAASDIMANYPHRVRMPVYPDSTVKQRTLRASVYTEGLVGSDSAIIIHHSTGDGERSNIGQSPFTLITIADSAAAGWRTSYDGDFDALVLESPDVTRGARDCYGYLAVYQTAVGGTQNVPPIYSLLIEGV